MVVTHRALGRSECAGDFCQRLFRSKRGQGPSNCRRRTGSGKGDWIVGDSSQRCGTEELGESDPVRDDAIEVVRLLIECEALAGLQGF